MPTQLFVGPNAPSGKKTTVTHASACARSAQSTSASSRPTLRRRRPGGTRSPSQRARLSMTESTPPRLVAFAITPQGRLDLSRGLGVRHVEREQPAEARVAHDLDRRVVAQPLREHLRGGRDPLHAHSKRLEAAEQQPARIRCGDDPRERAELPQPVRVLGRPADDRAEKDVVVAAEVLGRAVHREVGAVLERPQVDGRRGRRVDDHARRVRRSRLEVGHRQERVRGRLQEDEVGAVRRRPGLVELDVAQAPLLEPGEEAAGPEVGALGEGDRLPRLEQREHQRRDRAGPGGEEERVAALELAERVLGRDPGRVRVALVVEAARLAAVVRPDRRSVDGLHESQL